MRRQDAGQAPPDRSGKGCAKALIAQTTDPQKGRESGGTLSTLGAVVPTVDPLAPSVDPSDPVPKLTVCPKCGKPAWAPYVMQVRGKYGQLYRYQVFRHPDGRRHTPVKHTKKISEDSPDIS